MGYWQQAQFIDIRLPQFLKKMSIKALDWPGNRPALNPIENLWAADKQPSMPKIWRQ